MVNKTITKHPFSPVMTVLFGVAVAYSFSELFAESQPPQLKQTPQSIHLM